MRKPNSKKNPVYRGEISKAAWRSFEVDKCQKSKGKQPIPGIDGRFILVKETGCQVFLRNGESKKTVMERHIKFFEQNKYRMK